jgi:hypothetical protein
MHSVCPASTVLACRQRLDWLKDSVHSFKLSIRPWTLKTLPHLLLLLSLLLLSVCSRCRAHTFCRMQWRL